MSEAHLAQHKKELLVLRNLLVGKGFYDALAALELAQGYTVEMRKDGVTPGFQHQVGIALHVLTLPQLMHPEATIATVMTHDLPEDYDITGHEIAKVFTNKDMGWQVAASSDRLSKVFRGVKRNEDLLFEEMAKDPVASVVKGADRINNHNGMAGVFTRSKIVSYLEETEARILPMLKKAKRNFPHQTMTYENLSWTLKSQMRIIRGMLSMTED